MDCMQNEKQVFVQKQLTKADNKLSKTFYFTINWLLQLNYESSSNFSEGFLAKKRIISSLKFYIFYLFSLPIIATFIFSFPLLSADTFIARYPPEFH